MAVEKEQGAGSDAPALCSLMHSKLLPGVNLRLKLVFREISGLCGHETQTVAQRAALQRREQQMHPDLLSATAVFSRSGALACICRANPIHSNLVQNMIKTFF